jgi:hypothetical protein
VRPATQGRIIRASTAIAAATFVACVGLLAWAMLSLP